VLAQEDSSPRSSRFALAIASAPSLRDASVSVRCLAVGGSIDRACGIVWRVQDAKNYYLARANALEDNVRLYFVQNGNRHQIAGWDGAVTSCAWHTLRADMRGDHIEVYWDDKKVVDARDGRVSEPGRIGLWIKADSRTVFDDLTLREIHAPR
jgi:hypothetical protein